MIEIKLEGVDKALAMFDPNKVRLAANAALNRVAGAGRTEASKLIRQEYNIKASRVNQFLRLAVRARGYDMEAVITGKGLGQALAYFDAKQQGFKVGGAGAGSMRTKYLSRTGRKRGDVTVLVKKTGRKVLHGEQGNKPFLATMRGRLVILERKGKERFPVSGFVGPGVGGVFGTIKIMQAVKQHIIELWNKEFNRQLDYYLGRLK